MLSGLDWLPTGDPPAWLELQALTTTPCTIFAFKVHVVAVGMRERGKVRGDGDRRAGALPRLGVMIPGPRHSRSLKCEKIENSKTREHPTSQKKTLKVSEGGSHASSASSLRASIASFVSNTSLELLGILRFYVHMPIRSVVCQHVSLMSPVIVRH